MFKIINDGKVIELATSIKYYRYLKKSGRMVLSDPNSANCIQVCDTNNTYAIRGKHLPDSIPYPKVIYKSITQYEYDRLTALLSSNKEVTGDSIALIDARESKIAELKQECSKIICDGICVELSDGGIYQFDLTIEDQLNLRSIESRLGSSRVFFYHSKGEKIRPFSASDMRIIITTANRHIDYHTAYFNLIKYCIYNMYDITEINNIRYGDTLPEESCRDMLSYI